MQLNPTHYTRNKLPIMRKWRLGLHDGMRREERQSWAVIATSFGVVPSFIKSRPTPPTRLNILLLATDAPKHFRDNPNSTCQVVLYAFQDRRPLCQSPQIALASNRVPRNSGGGLSMVFGYIRHWRRDWANGDV
jgi:hypothetical protein